MQLNIALVAPHPMPASLESYIYNILWVEIVVGMWGNKKTGAR